MKTLKTITFSILLTAFATVALANPKATKYIGSTDDLRQLIKHKVESNFSDPVNFLNEMGVNKLNEKVEIIFLITPEQTIKIMSVDSNNSIAAEYIKRLLNEEKLNVDGILTGKPFKIDLVLFYRAA